MVQKIGLTQSGVWQVYAKNGRFDLRDYEDFWRVVALLEYPCSQANSVLEEYAEKIGANDRFSLWKVVSAGLTFERLLAGLGSWLVPADCSR